MPIHELIKDSLDPLSAVEVIAPDTLVIAEEFGEWEDSRRRIDLLGIDKEGYFIVIFSQLVIPPWFQT